MASFCSPIKRTLQNVDLFERIQNVDLFERKLDYGLVALMITGIVLLILGACISKGFIPLPGSVTNYFLGFGGGFFGIGGLGLLIRGCCNNG